MKKITFLFTMFAFIALNWQINAQTDDCASAPVITCATGTVSGDTSTATPEVIGSFSGESENSNSLWVKYVGDGSAITLSTCDGSGAAGGDADYDTKIDVYSGACDALVFVGGNDDGGVCIGSTYHSLFEFNSEVGVDYYIRIYSYADAEGYNEEGTFTMSIGCEAAIPPPANNECSGATALTIGTVITDEDNTNATANVANPSCDSFGAISDLWYSFVAPATGCVQVTTTLGTALDAGFAVYSGACDSLEALVCKEDVDGANTEAVLFMTVGETYYVQVWNNGGSEEGTFDVLVEEIAAPEVPEAVSNPTPADGAVDVVIDTTDSDGDGNPDMDVELSWDFATTGEPTADYVANIGTDINNLNAVGPFELTLNPVPYSGLSYSTTYYWQIVPRSEDGFGNANVAPIYSFTTQADPAASIADNTIEGFKMYPNPVKDILNFDASTTINSIYVYNLLGQEVLKLNSNSSQVQLKTSELTAGAYIVKVQAGDNVASYNLIKR